MHFFDKLVTNIWTHLIDISQNFSKHVISCDISPYQGGRCVGFDSKETACDTWSEEAWSECRLATPLPMDQGQRRNARPIQQKTNCKKKTTNFMNIFFKKISGALATDDRAIWFLSCIVGVWVGWGDFDAKNMMIQWWLRHVGSCRIIPSFVTGKLCLVTIPAVYGTAVHGNPKPVTLTTAQCSTGRSRLGSSPCPTPPSNRW